MGQFSVEKSLAPGSVLSGNQQPDVFFDMMTLLMFRLLQVPDAILPSDEIAEMAKQARKVRLYSKRHEWYWRNDPRFKKILDPRRMKLAFADETASKQWQNELGDGT
jgi:hypothetical protein